MTTRGRKGGGRTLQGWGGDGKDSEWQAAGPQQQQRQGGQSPPVGRRDVEQVTDAYEPQGGKALGPSRVSLYVNTVWVPVCLKEERDR